MMDRSHKSEELIEKWDERVGVSTEKPSVPLQETSSYGKEDSIIGTVGHESLLNSNRDSTGSQEPSSDLIQGTKSSKDVDLGIPPHGPGGEGERPPKKTRRSPVEDSTTGPASDASIVGDKDTAVGQNLSVVSVAPPPVSRSLRRNRRAQPSRTSTRGGNGYPSSAIDRWGIRNLRGMPLSSFTGFDRGFSIQSSEWLRGVEEPHNAMLRRDLGLHGTSSHFGEGSNALSLHRPYDHLLNQDMEAGAYLPRADDQIRALSSHNVGLVRPQQVLSSMLPSRPSPMGSSLSGVEGSPYLIDPIVQSLNYSMITDRWILGQREAPDLIGGAGHLGTDEVSNLLLPHVLSRLPPNYSTALASSLLRGGLEGAPQHFGGVPGNVTALFGGRQSDGAGNIEGFEQLSWGPSTVAASAAPSRTFPSQARESNVSGYDPRSKFHSASGVVRRQNKSDSNQEQSFHVVMPRTSSAGRALRQVPEIEEDPVTHYSQRTSFPLATDEDENWLSEFLCFIRSDLIEIFRAGNDDVASRINSKQIIYGQIGIRCRYCAHLPHSDRSSRSASFPSSLDRIYQSLTMMIRDHFVRCPALPEALRSRFLELKARTTQGATDSKKYWIDSAKQLGLVDSENQGIIISEKSIAAAAALGISSSRSRARSTDSSEMGEETSLDLVNASDKPFVTEFVFFLMSQVQKVYLSPSERVGNRKGMELGTPGFACKHCCASDRMGLCRFFPARRRTLPAKIKDLADHIRRCTVCPLEVKEELLRLKERKVDMEPSEDNNKHFLDRVWTRLHARPGVECTSPYDSTLDEAKDDDEHHG